MSQTQQVEKIKAAFTGKFPEASQAISLGSEGEKIHALAMYAAFKEGYLIGLREGNAP